MKKINLLLVSLLFVLGGVFTSCSDDETNDASINLLAGPGFVSDNATVAVDSIISIKWLASSSTNIEYVSILKDGAILPTWNMEEIENADKNSYSDMATISITSAGTYAVVVYDKDKVELARVEFVITVGAAIKSYATINMGGSASSYGSYLDLDSDPPTVYKQADMTDATKKAAVDVIFDLGKVQNTSTTITSSTGTTFLATSITTAEFDAMTTDAGFKSLAPTANSATVSTGKVVAFKTKAGKLGLLKVTNMVSNTGDFTIAVKIQK